MAAIDDQILWIKERLPPGASFSKNGVTQTIDEAARRALSRYTAGDVSDQKNALADLLESLAANMKFDTETIGDYTYSRPTLSKQAKQWRDEAGTETAGGVGGFSFIPIKRRRRCAVDENAG